MKDKYRLFELIVYNTSDHYDINEVLKCIRGYKKYAYCYHDKDLKEDGTPKEPHYHIIINLDNACTISALSKKTSVPENMINHIRNERSYVRYLIHFDDPDKAQYNDIIMSRSYQRFISKCFDDKETEEEILQKLWSFIDSICSPGENYANVMYALINFVNQNCYDTIYKRYRYEFNEYIKNVLTY